METYELEIIKLNNILSIKQVELNIAIRKLHSKKYDLDREKISKLKVSYNAWSTISDITLINMNMESLEKEIDQLDCEIIFLEREILQINNKLNEYNRIINELNEINDSLKHMTTIDYNSSNNEMDCSESSNNNDINNLSNFLQNNLTIESIHNEYLNNRLEKAILRTKKNAYCSNCSDMCCPSPPQLERTQTLYNIHTTTINVPCNNCNITLVYEINY